MAELPDLLAQLQLKLAADIEEEKKTALDEDGLLPTENNNNRDDETTSSDDDDYEDSEDDYESEEETVVHDEEGYIPFPQIVLDEMTRRRQSDDEQQHVGPISRRSVSNNNNNDKPKSSLLIKALRQHFQQERICLDHGGYLDCLRALGITPSSQDPMVYDIQYNIRPEDYSLDSYPPIIDNMNQMDFQHQADVRLLRYRELIDVMRDTKGITPNEEWTLLGGTKSNNDDDDLDLEYDGDESICCQDTLSME